MNYIKFMPIAVVFIALVSLPSRAQNRATTMSPEAIRAAVKRADSKGERLIVKLKSGKSISGTVTLSPADGLVVTADQSLFGDRESVTIWLSDVESVKGRNPFVKGVKTAGIVTFTIAAVPIVIPIWVISTLLHHPVLAPCSSGSMH